MQTMMQIFAEELRKSGEENPDIVALSADVKRSTGLGLFAEVFPDRYYEMGISEQNMIGAAAGMAMEGKRAVTSSYACFSPGRTWEQIRNGVCYHQADVKIIGAHIGVGSGRDGATHQCFEDIALISCLPYMRIYSPATAAEVRLCSREILSYAGPAYLRLSARYCAEPDGYVPAIDSISTLKKGKEYAVIGTGAILAKALDAVKRFEQENNLSVAVFNVVRLVPMEREKIKEMLAPFKAVLSIEEHQLIGGFGSMIASVLAEQKEHPPLYRIGVDSAFGASMESEELYRSLKISESDIVIKLTEMHRDRP